MDTKQEKVITIRNLGQGHHIFGAVFLHPNDDPKLQPICVHATESLAPGGSISMSKDQFKFYDDEVMKKRVDTREFAILANGRDIRPELAKRDKPVTKSPMQATESDATKESSVLADILAEEDPKQTE